MVANSLPGCQSAAPRSAAAYWRAKTAPPANSSRRISDSWPSAMIEYREVEMETRLSRKWGLPLAATVIMLALVGLIAVAFPDEPAPITAASSVPSTEAFTYTGYLEWGGAPANGLFDFSFSVYTLDVGGSLVGSVEVVDDQLVENGVFTVYLTCGGPQLVFDGGPRWLQVEVRPRGERHRLHSAATPTDRRHALCLDAASLGARRGRPAAERPGRRHPGHQANRCLPDRRGVGGHTLATGTAVRGLATTGWGVYGYSERSYAVYGVSNATSSATPAGYGGYFTANNGIGVYGESGSTAHYGHGGWLRSQWGNGVYATSAQNAAVRGEGGNISVVAGIWQPAGPSGVVGLSGSASGVWGASRTGTGVVAYSNSGVGLIANSASGNMIEGLGHVGFEPPLLC